MLAGVVVGIVSLLADYFGIGSGGIQAAQLLGTQFGIVVVLIGYAITRLEDGLKIPSLRSISSMVANRILNTQPYVWFFVTFFGVYLWMFVSPIFLNTDLQMQYFNRFIPHGGRIGMDMRAIVEYIYNWLVLDQSPYASGFIAYPPFALILFSPFLLIGYPAYFYVMTFLTLLCHLISALIIPLLITNRRNVSLTILIFATSLFSYGFQFELERAQFNIIAFTFALLAIYIFHYHPRYRVIAYFFISISIQLKIYPAIFLLLLIENWKDWRGNLIRFASLGFVNIAALFLLGAKTFAEFSAAVRSQQSYGPSWNGNHSIQGFVNQLILDGFGLFPESTLVALRGYSGSIQLAVMMIFLLCLLVIVIKSYHRNEGGLNPYLLLVCTVGALILPSISNDYKLSILAAPMAILAGMLIVSSQGRVLSKTLNGIVLILFSGAYWILQYPFKFKPEILTRSFLALFILLLAGTLLYIFRLRQNVSES